MGMRDPRLRASTLLPHLMCALPAHGTSFTQPHAPSRPAWWANHTFGDTHYDYNYVCQRCTHSRALCDRAAQVLSCYALMATGAQDQVELAVGQLLEVAAVDRDNVPVVLALATGFMLLRQTPKARQALLSAVLLLVMQLLSAAAQAPPR